MQPKLIPIRKRTQIANANRAMFIWIAVVSALFGFAVVVSMFLIQMISFNEKVIKEKNNTIAVLKINNENIVALKDQIRVLEASEILENLKVDSSDNALQVILDALPSDANSPALGSSLQNKLLDVNGVSIDSLNVVPVIGVESLSADGSLEVETNSIDGVVQSEIPFSFSVIGSEEDLRTLLQNLEKSIRTIDITSMEIEKQTSSNSDGGSSDYLLLKVIGRAYYQEEQVIELKDMVIKA